jgi:hypothetical protein
VFIENSLGPFIGGVSNGASTEEIYGETVLFDMFRALSIFTPVSLASF